MRSGLKHEVYFLQQEEKITFKYIFNLTINSTDTLFPCCFQICWLEEPFCLTKFAYYMHNLFTVKRTDHEG